MAGRANAPPGPSAAPGKAIILGSRPVTAAEQERFAELAADRNPNHVDSAAARRSIAGPMGVHGAHTLLWSLDLLARSALRPRGVGIIDARFAKPLYLGEEAECRVEPRADGSLTLRVQVGEKAVATILVGRSGDDAPDLAPPADL